MNYLLDTHILIWFLEGDSKLKDKPRKAIVESTKRKFVSIVSIWEIALKISLKKLETDFSVEEIKQLIAKNNFFIVPVEYTHCLGIIDLPFHHKDPFDRMLISQAISEDLTIITEDQDIKLYEQVKIL